MSRYTYEAEAAALVRARADANEMRLRHAPFALGLELRIRKAMADATFEPKWALAWALYDRISDTVTLYQRWDVEPYLRADLAALVERLEGMTRG